MTSSPAERSLAAEVRAVEQGHYARVQDDGSILVKSDTRPGKSWRVTFAADAPGSPITFTCRPEGNTAYEGDHRDLTSRPGFVFCTHSALAARRLAREKLALLTLGSGQWVLTERAAELTDPRPPPTPQPVDPADAAAGRALFGSL